MSDSMVTFGDVWDTKPPKEPGWYWLKGDPWSQEILGLYLVEVWLTANDKLMYISHGDALHVERNLGVWQRILFSNLPKDVVL